MKLSDDDVVARGSLRGLVTFDTKWIGSSRWSFATLTDVDGNDLTPPIERASREFPAPGFVLIKGKELFGKEQQWICRPVQT